MSDEQIRDETLVAYLESRGYTVEKPETELSQKVSRLEDKLRQMEQEPRSPEQEEQRFAEELRDHMNRSVSRWYEPGGADAA